MRRKKKIFLGIDPGTTLSEIAVVNESGAVEVIQNCDGDLKTPSVVSYSSGEPVVGKAALPDAFLAPGFSYPLCKKEVWAKEPRRANPYHY